MENRELHQFIILRRVPYGDTSLVVHLFSAEHGRQAALAKGAFREKSPIYGSLDLLNEIRAHLGGRRAEALKILTNAELLDAHRGLRRDLRTLTVALYSAELLESAVTETPAPALFIQLRDWLSYLESPAAKDPVTLRTRLLAFELQFLDNLGLRPSLDACGGCGNTQFEDGRVAWHVAAGGVVCPSCAARTHGAGSFSVGALAAARSMAAGQPPPALATKESRELRAFLDRFHAYHLDRALRSRPSLEILWRGDAA